MDEYISRKDAISKIREEGVYGSGYSNEEREDNVVDMLASIPAADVRPVVRGRWIERTHKLYDGDTGYSIECTHCHEVFTEISLRTKPTKRNFCPNCGADMREES